MPNYANEDERIMSKLCFALDAAQEKQRISEEKVNASVSTLATAVARAEDLMKQNTDAFAHTDRILAEAVAYHAKMTAYFKAEKEKYERDAADEQGALKRILAAAEQEKASADADIASCRMAFAFHAHNVEKEERAADAVREQREREAAAAEAAARRARELREHEAAARPATRSLISEQTKQAILIRQGGLCGKASTGHGCGQKLHISRADGEPKPIFDIDHIVPLSDMRWRYGGDCNNFENLQLLCPNCHAIKTRYTDRGRVIG